MVFHPVSSSNIVGRSKAVQRFERISLVAWVFSGCFAQWRWTLFWSSSDSSSSKAFASGSRRRFKEQSMEATMCPTASQSIRKEHVVQDCLALLKSGSSPVQGAFQDECVWIFRGDVLVTSPVREMPDLHGIDTSSSCWENVGNHEGRQADVTVRLRFYFNIYGSELCLILLLVSL